MRISSISWKLFTLVIILTFLVTLMPDRNAVGQASTLTFQPVADAFVDQSNPKKNFGTQPNLSVDGSPLIRSYLRFDVRGVSAGRIISAKLRLFVTDDSSSGFTVTKVSSNDWVETKITHNNAPDLGSSLTSTGSYSSGIWLEMDVTGAVTGDGLVSLALTTPADTTTAVASREGGANAPQLIVNIEGSGSIATATATATVYLPTVTNTPVPSATPAPVNQNGSFVFKPVADAFVHQSNSSTNYGTQASLSVDGSPVIRSYLRFDVGGLNGAPVSSARLRLYVVDDSSSGFTVAKVSSNSWGETSLTFSNAPAVGGSIRGTGSYKNGVWLDIDITGAVTGDGLVSLALTTSADTTTAVASREAGATSPQLVLTTGSGSTEPPPTPPAPSPTPTSPAPSPTPNQPSQVVPYGVTGSWRLIFQDEFNGTLLDLNKWEPNWLAGNNTAITKPVNSRELSCYDPAQVSVGGGTLKLSAVARSCKANNGITYNYASGLVNSRQDFTFSYGYMEARVWMDGSSTPKNWPAFWANGTGQWPTTGEIDVMEALGGKLSWHYHWGTTSNHESVGGYPTMSSSVGWHIFGAEWQPGSVKYYYDGKYVGQATEGIVSGPMYLILNYGLSTSISPPVQVPSHYLVDYVRVWQK